MNANKDDKTLFPKPEILEHKDTKEEIKELFPKPEILEKQEIPIPKSNFLDLFKKKSQDGKE